MLRRPVFKGTAGKNIVVFRSQAPNGNRTKDPEVAAGGSSDESQEGQEGEEVKNEEGVHKVLGEKRRQQGKGGKTERVIIENDSKQPQKPHFNRVSRTGLAIMQESAERFTLFVFFFHSRCLFPAYWSV
jgi:hypothetical protein